MHLSVLHDHDQPMLCPSWGEKSKHEKIMVGDLSDHAVRQSLSCFHHLKMDLFAQLTRCSERLTAIGCQIKMIARIILQSRPMIFPHWRTLPLSGERICDSDANPLPCFASIIHGQWWLKYFALKLGAKERESRRQFRRFHTRRFTQPNWAPCMTQVVLIEPQVPTLSVLSLNNLFLPHTQSTLTTRPLHFSEHFATQKGNSTLRHFTRLRNHKGESLSATKISIQTERREERHSGLITPSKPDRRCAAFACWMVGIDSLLQLFEFLTSWWRLDIHVKVPSCVHCPNCSKVKWFFITKCSYSERTKAKSILLHWNVLQPSKRLLWVLLWVQYTVKTGQVRMRTLFTGQITRRKSHTQTIHTYLLNVRFSRNEVSLMCSKTPKSAHLRIIVDLSVFHERAQEGVLEIRGMRARFREWSAVCFWMSLSRPLVLHEHNVHDKVRKRIHCREWTKWTLTPSRLLLTLPTREIWWKRLFWFT